MPTASTELRASPVSQPAEGAAGVDDAPRQSPGPANGNGGEESEDERQYMMLRHSDEDEANGNGSNNGNGNGGHDAAGEAGAGQGVTETEKGPHHIPKSPERTSAPASGAGPRSVSMRGRGTSLPTTAPPAGSAQAQAHAYHPQHHQLPPPMPFRVGGPHHHPPVGGPGSPLNYMRGVSEDANSLTSYGGAPYPPPHGGPGVPPGAPGGSYDHYDPSALSIAPSWGSIDMHRVGTFDYGDSSMRVGTFDYGDSSSNYPTHHHHAGYGSNGSNVITPAQTIRKGPPPPGYPGPSSGMSNNYYMYPPSSPIKAGPSPKASPECSPKTNSFDVACFPSPRQSPRVEPDDDEVEGPAANQVKVESEENGGVKIPGTVVHQVSVGERAQRGDRIHAGSDEEGLTAEWLPPRQSSNKRTRRSSSGGNERVVAPSATAAKKEEAKSSILEPATIHVPKAPSAGKNTNIKLEEAQEEGGSASRVPQPQFARHPSQAPKSGPPTSTGATSSTPPRYRPPLVVDTSRSLSHASTDSSESPGTSLYYSGRIQVVGGGIGSQWDTPQHPPHHQHGSPQHGGAPWSLVSRSRSAESSGGNEGASNEWEPPRPTRQPMVPPAGRPSAPTKSVSAPAVSGGGGKGGYPEYNHHDPYGMRPPPPPPGYYGYDYYGKGGPPPPPSSGTPPGAGPPPTIQKSYSSGGGRGGTPPGAPPHHPGYPPSSYSPERPPPPPRSSSDAYPGYPGYPKSGAGPPGSYPYPGYPSSQYPPHHPYSSYPPPPHQGPHSKYPPGPPGSSLYPGYGPPPPPPRLEDDDSEPAPHPLLKDYNPHRDGMAIRPQFQNVKKSKAVKRTHAATTAPGASGAGASAGAMLPPRPHPAGPNMGAPPVPGAGPGVVLGPGPNGAPMQTPRRRRRRNPDEKAAAAAAMAAAAEAALKERKEKLAKIKEYEDKENETRNAAAAAKAAEQSRAGSDIHYVGGLSGAAGVIKGHITSPFSEEELKTLGSGDDEDIPAAKRAAMASAVALRAAAGGSPLEPPKSAAEVDFDIADPPPSPICLPSEVPVLESATLMTENDVLCGRGGGTNSQMGNRRFRALVRDFQPTYLMAKRREKPKMARSVVLIVRHRGGRFLRRDDKDGRLYEVGDEKAEAKTSQALREGLDVRATKTAANTLMGSADGSGKKRKTSPVVHEKRTESPAVKAAAERSAKNGGGEGSSSSGRAMPPRPQPVHAPGYNHSGRPVASSSRPTRPPPPTARSHSGGPYPPSGHPPASHPSGHPSAAPGYYPPYPPRYDDPYYRSRYPPHPSATAASAAATAAYEYGGPSHCSPPPPGSHPPPPPTMHHHHHHHYAGAGAAGGYPPYPGPYGAGGYGAPPHPSSAAGGPPPRGPYPSPPRSSHKSTRDAPRPSSSSSGGAFSPPRGPPPPNVTPVVSRPKGLHS